MLEGIRPLLLYSTLRYVNWLNGLFRRQKLSVVVLQCEAYEAREDIIASHICYNDVFIVRPS